MSRPIAVAGAWLVWWALLFWLWLLISGEWNAIQIVAAACAATVAATFAEVARHRAGVHHRLPLAWVARSWSVPVLVFADFGVLVWALVRRRPGAFVAREFPAADAPGVRAWATIAATYSPNAYVVDIDTERQLVLLHDLVPWPPSESPA